MSLKRGKHFSFIRAQHYCVTHSNTRDTKQRCSRTKRQPGPEGPAGEQVTPPYVSNSRCGVAKGCSWWTGWSWRPCTSPLAHLPLHRHPKGAWGQTAECCSDRAQRGPGLGRTSAGWGPWRRGCGWAGISPSLPAGKRRPGASSRAWAAPRWSWERQGSPMPPAGWETSLDSDKEQKTKKGSFSFLGRKGWVRAKPWASSSLDQGHQRTKNIANSWVAASKILFYPTMSSYCLDPDPEQQCHTSMSMNGDKSFRRLQQRGGCPRPPAGCYSFLLETVYVSCQTLAYFCFLGLWPKLD